MHLITHKKAGDSHVSLRPFVLQRFYGAVFFPIQKVLKFHLSLSSISPSVIDNRVCSRTRYEQFGQVVMFCGLVPNAPRGPDPLGKTGAGETVAAVTISMNQ